MRFDVWVMDENEQCSVTVLIETELPRAAGTVGVLAGMDAEAYAFQQHQMDLWDVGEGSGWPTQPGGQVFAKRVS